MYVYVVATVEWRDGQFVQSGNSPNFQGGLITLCVCKHFMRTDPTFRNRVPVWVAGITSSGKVDGRRCRHLFYLMFVPPDSHFGSQAEMWESLPRATREAKSASRSPVGDFYEPLSEGLRGKATFLVENYRPPCDRHGHLAGNTWCKDIDSNYGGRRGRPDLLKGDPRYSYLWTLPSIRLEELAVRLPGNPHGYRSTKEFLDDLRPDTV